MANTNIENLNFEVMIKFKRLEYPKNNIGIQYFVNLISNSTL